MVTQTWGWAEAAVASTRLPTAARVEKSRRLIMDLPARLGANCGRTISRSAADWRPIFRHWFRDDDEFMRPPRRRRRADRARLRECRWGAARPRRRGP